MNRDTKKIDVLSWFDDLIRNGEEHHLEDAVKARAAVAELIESMTWAMNNPTDYAYWITKAKASLDRIGGET